MMLRALFSIAALALAVHAQTPTPRYTFEVASVKRAPDVILSGGRGSIGIPPALTDDPLLNFREVILSGVVRRAYNVMPPLQMEVPDWMNTARYNISARVPADAPKGHVAEMLQNLLADRFHMVVHWQTTEESGYVLTVRTQPLKLKKHEDGPGLPAGKGLDMSPTGHIFLRDHTLDDLANTLSSFMGGRVVNQTGVEGRFDITIDAAPDSMPGFRLPGAPTDSPMPTIFTALRDMGLNLQKQKVPVTRLIVDSANKIPTEN